MARVEVPQKALIVVRPPIADLHAPPMIHRWRPPGAASHGLDTVTREQLASVLADASQRIILLTSVQSPARSDYLICALRGGVEYAFCGRIQLRSEEYLHDEQAYADIVGPICFAAVRADAIRGGAEGEPTTSAFGLLTPAEQGEIHLQLSGYSPFPVLKFASHTRFDV